MASARRAAFAAASFLSFLATTLNSGSALAQPSSSLPSSVVGPALDASQFAPGALRDHVSDHGLWRLTCREAPGLKQRFCSMSSSSALPEGGGISLTITTTASGAPAGMLQLPLGLVLTRPIEIQPAALKGAAAAKAAIKAGAVLCDASGCATVFALQGVHLASLSRGDGLRVSFQALPAREFQSVALQPLSRARSVSVVMSGRGFQDAIRMSSGG